MHVHYAIPHASAAYMAQQILLTQGLKIPFITTLHGTDITLVGKDPSFEPVITFSINKSDIVTAVSENLKSETNQLFNIQKNIQVVPNFINIKEYQMNQNQYYKKRYAPNGEKIICHVSNFRKVKRIGDVIKTFNMVAEKIKTKLILVGDGPERNQLEMQARKSKFNEHIHFLGNLKSTKEVLNISDLFLLPSSKESFGLAALEAMACKVPVVATNTGGIPEVVENEYSGFLSEVGNFEKMAENCLTIISKDDKLKEFKSNAFKTAQKFNIEKVLPKYEKLYNQVIN